MVRGAPPPLTAEGTPNAAVAVDRSLDMAYPTTYFGGSTESEGAEAIAIKGGDQAQIDIHLRPAQALHLIFHAADTVSMDFSLPFFKSDRLMPWNSLSPKAHNYRKVFSR